MNLGVPEFIKIKLFGCFVKKLIILSYFYFFNINQGVMSTVEIQHLLQYLQIQCLLANLNDLFVWPNACSKFRMTS